MPDDPEICTDCGSRPRWWRSEDYCRECSDKNGYRYESHFVVDPDEVLAYFEGDKAKADDFLKKTASWR